MRHSRPRLLRRHVYRQHHGQRHRSARHEPAQQLRAKCHLAGENGRLPPRQRLRHRNAQERIASARHFDEEGVRERHHGRHCAGRFDQRRVASARHRALGESEADARRLQPRGQKRARARGLETERQTFDVRTRRHRRHPMP